MAWSTDKRGYTFWEPDNCDVTGRTNSGPYLILSFPSAIIDDYR